MRTLLAYYDLSVGPVSFDFVTFLVKAELARRTVKASRLHVVVVPFEKGVAGMFRDKTHLYDEHEMRWRLWNIVIPACSLMPGTGVTLALNWEQARRLRGKEDLVFPDDWDKQTLRYRSHLVGSLVEAARAGAEIPRLTASQQALRKVRRAFGRSYITMTLRNTYLPERNSAYQDWEAVKGYLGRNGYSVVVLQDTGRALSNGRGYGELNIDLRLATYQQASLNLQSNNGTASLCWFSDAPYFMFGAGVPAEEWDGLFVKQGLPLGESWPWASARQKLVYGKESIDSMVAEVEAWGGVTR